MEGRAAVAETPGEPELGWVETQDPSRRREGRSAERREAAVAAR